MKTLLALLLTTSSAVADTNCSNVANKEVIANLEKDYGETIHFVGSIGSDVHNAPMELFISDAGTWTLLAVVADGICLIAAGKDWQAMEPKPKGTEN